MRVVEKFSSADSLRICYRFGARFLGAFSTGEKRAAIAPSVPTAIEQGVKGLEITAWLGLFAPAGTPNSIVESLHRSVVTVARRDDFVKRMADSGAEVVASSPAQFADFFKREIALYKKVAATANIHLE